MCSADDIQAPRLRKVSLFLTDEHILFLDLRSRATGTTRSELTRSAINAEMRFFFDRQRLERERLPAAVR